jgi:hypothetical protein
MTMKKLATTLALMLAGASAVMAQGFLAAANNSSTPLTAVSGTTSNIVGSAGALLGQGSVYVSLWVATNGAPSTALAQVAIGTNATSSFPGAIGTFNLSNPLTLNAPWDGSFQIELLYRAWSLSLGPTWSSSWVNGGPTVGTFAGQSALLTGFSLGTGSSAPPATFGAGLLNGLVLQTSTPEPSTIVLAGLGIASLLAIRRRK